MPFVRCYCWLLLLGLALVVGCDNVGIRNPFAKPAPPAKAVAANPAPSPGVQKADPVAARKAREAEARGSMIQTRSMRGGKTAGGGTMEERLDVHDAVSRIGDDLKNTIGYQPALVVWMVDATQSAAPLRRGFQEAASKLYEDLGTALAGKPADQLTTAIVAVHASTSTSPRASTAPRAAAGSRASWSASGSVIEAPRGIDDALQQRRMSRHQQPYVAEVAAGDQLDELVVADQCRDGVGEGGVEDLAGGPGQGASTREPVEAT